MKGNFTQLLNDAMFFTGVESGLALLFIALPLGRLYYFRRMQTLKTCTAWSSAQSNPLSGKTHPQSCIYPLQNFPNSQPKPAPTST